MVKKNTFYNKKRFMETLFKLYYTIPRVKSKYSHAGNENLEIAKSEIIQRQLLHKFLMKL